MNDQQIAARKEAAVYAATETARIGNRESTWFYFGEDSEYAVTAWPENGKVRVKTKRV